MRRLVSFCDALALVMALIGFGVLAYGILCPSAQAQKKDPVVITIHNPEREAPCDAWRYETMHKRDDGAYDRLLPTPMPTCKRPASVRQEKWTDYPENGGKRIEVLPGQEETSQIKVVHPETGAHQLQPGDKPVGEQRRGQGAPRRARGGQ